jgi:hypothetical protein
MATADYREAIIDRPPPPAGTLRTTRNRSVQRTIAALLP